MLKVVCNGHGYDCYALPLDHWTTAPIKRGQQHEMTGVVIQLQYWALLSLSVQPYGQRASWRIIRKSPAYRTQRREMKQLNPSALERTASKQSSSLTKWIGRQLCTDDFSYVALRLSSSLVEKPLGSVYLSWITGSLTPECDD